MILWIVVVKKIFEWIQHPGFIRQILGYLYFEEIVIELGSNIY